MLFREGSRLHIADILYIVHASRRPHCRACLIAGNSVLHGHAHAEYVPELSVDLRRYKTLISKIFGSRILQFSHCIQISHCASVVDAYQTSPLIVASLAGYVHIHGNPALSVAYQISV